MAESSATPVPQITSGPTTARGRRTRAALLDAARQIVENAGFPDMRINDICEVAGVSHGTFYVYFDSKEAIFKEIVTAVIGDMFVSTRLHNSAELQPYQRVEEANRLYLRAFRRNSQVLRVLDHVASTNEQFRQLLVELRSDFVRRIEAGLEQMQSAGTLPAELPPRATAIALAGMVQHFAHVLYDLGEDVDEDTAVLVLTSLWARATGIPDRRLPA